MSMLRLAFVLAACLFTAPPASATYIALRISDNYIVVGTDSRSPGVTDRYCKIEILDDTHFFTATGTGRLYSPDHGKFLDVADLARRAFKRNPEGSVDDLRDSWADETRAALKNLPPEVISGIGQLRTADFEPFFFKGMFGEIRKGGSKLAASIVTMNKDAEIQRIDSPDIGRVDDFISENPEHAELGKAFYSQTRAHATDSADADARTMRRLVQFVIEHTRFQDGGEPIVAVLEYGKPARWVAGGDICGH